MGHVNSPLQNNSINLQEAAFNQLKMLSLRFLRQTQEFLEAQKLPYVAHKTCNIYLGKTGKIHQAQCRRILQTRLALNPKQLHSFFHTSLGNDMLAWAGQFFQMSDSKDDEGCLRDLLLQMAADPEGLSLLNFLRRSDTVQLNLDRLLFLADRLQWILKAAEQTLEAIHQLSVAETQPEAGVDFASLLDIRQSGPFAVKQYRLVLEKPQQNDSSAQLCDVDEQQQEVFCYQPAHPEGQMPVVIQSHGLAASAEDLASYAKHLASYGFFVAAPQHAGSDAMQVRNMLAGNTHEVFKLSEFISRPCDVSYLLDELESRNLKEFSGKLNLDGVGVMGYSFGAYTAFALAGANIDFETLEQACDLTVRQPNLSLLLQCQALGLPRQFYQFHDRRVGAILAIDSVGSEILGSQSIQNIQIPVMLIAGSQDAAAPLMLEQIRLFQWLTSSNAYLALMRGKSHIQDMQRLVNNLDLQIKLSPRLRLATEALPFEQYLKALSLAFFNQFLVKADSIPPLTADYAAYLSQAPFDLWLISQASSQSLQQKLQALENL
jgi:predicted dienelactone hydrolase